MSFCNHSLASTLSISMCPYDSNSPQDTLFSSYVCLSYFSLCLPLPRLPKLSNSSEQTCHLFKIVLFIPLKTASSLFSHCLVSQGCEQTICKSSKCRMRRLVDWLLNPHWTPDTRKLTYLLLSNGT